jgi:hypothetical protein
MNLHPMMQHAMRVLQPSPPQAPQGPIDPWVHGQALLAATAELRLRLHEIDGDEIAHGVAADITRLVIGKYAAAYAAIADLHAADGEGRR